MNSIFMPIHIRYLWKKLIFHDQMDLLIAFRHLVIQNYLFSLVSDVHWLKNGIHTSIIHWMWKKDISYMKNLPNCFAIFNRYFRYTVCHKKSTILSVENGNFWPQGVFSYAIITQLQKIWNSWFSTYKVVPFL